MVKEYKSSQVANRLMMWASRFGIGPSQTLATVGRRSGAVREVPVTPITVDGTEYLVAPYGAVSWVLNARANPEVTLRRGSEVRRCRLVDVTDATAHVVKAYWDKERFPRPFMDVPGDATEADFASVAGRFPVFEVHEAR